jgi:uncharacterized damage-inducible protein DinB
MYRSIKDFLDSWKYESEMTLKLFKNLTDESLGRKIVPEGRSLGFLAWHITVTLSEMGGKAGLIIEAPSENSPVPVKVSEIVATYDKAGKSVVSEITGRWNDGMLTEEIDMYGQKWTRSRVLSSLILHQVHHRAQMTVLMRQAGLQVPGIYGPSREEWSGIGMKAPE